MKFTVFIYSEDEREMERVPIEARNAEEALVLFVDEDEELRDYINSVELLTDMEDQSGKIVVTDKQGRALMFKFMDAPFVGVVVEE